MIVKILITRALGDQNVELVLMLRSRPSATPPMAINRIGRPLDIARYGSLETMFRVP